MVIRVHAKNGKCFACYVGICDSPRLDDGANVLALILQLTLQGSCGTMFRDLTQTLAGQLSILPESIVQGVGGPNNIAESGAPAIRGKILGMCVT